MGTPLWWLFLYASLGQKPENKCVWHVCFMYIFLVCSASVFLQPDVDSNHWCVICCIWMVICFMDHAQCLPSVHGSDMSSVMLLRSALSLQISCKVMWSSYGFFPCNVLIFVYEYWLLHYIWPENFSSPILRYYFVEQTWEAQGSTHYSQANTGVQVMQGLELVLYPAAACTFTVCSNFWLAPCVILKLAWCT